MILTPKVVLPATGGESNHTAVDRLTISKPSNAQTGDILVAVLRCGSAVQNSDYTLAGWTRRSSPFEPASAGSRVTGIYTHFISDESTEPAEYIFALTGNSHARQSGLIFIVRPDENSDSWDVEPTIYGNDGATIGSGFGFVHPFAAPDSSLQILGLGTELVAPHALTSFATTGDAEMIGVHGSLADQANTGATRSAVAAVSAPVVDGVSGGSMYTLSWPSLSGTWIGGIAIPGTQQKVSDDRERFSSVRQLLASKNATVMHRAPTGYSESTKNTYDLGYSIGFSAFEMSLGFSSDLVPFGLGSRYLDYLALGTSTTTLDPDIMTWSEIQEYNNVMGSNAPQPFYSLDDFLTDFVDSGKGVAIVDPKWGFSVPAKVNAMLDICDSHGGPSKILIKFDSPTSNKVLPNLAHARGYRTINYWSDDHAALELQHDGWDILGGAYDAGAEMWSKLHMYGKPTWAAILPSQEAYNQAITNTNANFFVVRTLSIEPVGPKDLTVALWNGSSEETVTLTIWDGVNDQPVGMLELEF